MMSSACELSLARLAAGAGLATAISIVSGRLDLLTAGGRAATFILGRVLIGLGDSTDRVTYLPSLFLAFSSEIP